MNMKTQHNQLEPMDEANTLLSVVANLQTRTKEMEDKLKELGLFADAD